MSLRRIISFWRYHEYSKYVFRMVEEHTKTIKKKRTKHIFRKIVFKISKFSKFSKIENVREQSEKPKFQKKMKFQNYVEIFDCSDCFLKILIFENFENLKIWKSIFAKIKLFFVRIFLYCLGIFFRNPKHVFITPMIPSDRCYSA